jgi:hypothetical protein
MQTRRSTWLNAVKGDTILRVSRPPQRKRTRRANPLVKGVNGITLLHHEVAARNTGMSLSRDSRL